MIQKKRFHSGLLSRDDDRSANDLNQYKSSVSPLRRYRSGSISPYRNESPKSPFREGAGFLGVPKEVENFNAHKIASSRRMFKALQDVSRNQISDQRGSDPTLDHPVEKTVYIDYVKNKDMLDTCGHKSSMKQAKKQSHKLGSTQDIKPRTLEVLSDAKSGVKEETKQEPDLPCKSPLAPPLPKSPSESWLWRTIPSITLGNPFANSRRSSPIHPKKQAQKGSSANTKWETIVKTSNLRHDHVRYSQVLVMIF